MDFYSFKNHMQKLVVIDFPHHSSVFREYEKCFEDSLVDTSILNIKYKTFHKLWTQLTPHIKFLNSSSDLCENCETFRLKLFKLKSLNEEDEEIDMQLKFHEHLIVKDDIIIVLERNA